ncbi:efflux RND transporter periplasmic adaptor subunit [Rubinisphaera margarita]|uniref:efflux RND transporter periplasmic adaptor subunit n=1 Tax=Rubinisphaera margarita TaxID=2909586 RepID=UPI001EE89D80|nr:HlyD family efflux transporter periplasmic adaptor subunit [Rubinisphaera margarita]MCG6156432.1 HlyD family efflux transporter periplasmic adaptor subunit [Rubinisphaera margarita]
MYTTPQLFAAAVNRPLAVGLIALSALLLPVFTPVSVFAQPVEEEVVADEAVDIEVEAVEKAEPPTHTVEAEEFLATISTTGVFVSPSYEEILLQPKAWTTLKVVSAAPHGSSVMEGDPVLVLETEDLDEAIVKARKAIVTTTLALRMAADELRFLKETTAMDLEQSTRSAKEAADDLEYYLTVQEQEDLKSAELALKFAQYRLEYAQEELDQLQQMYEADDLTEQTEEIVLKRAQRDVEQAERSVEQSELRRDRLVETLIPREKQQMQDAQARSAISKAKAVTLLPLMLQQKELEIEKLQQDLTEKKEQLAEMEADRGGMTIQAPQSGIVYYGRAAHGKFSEVAAREKQLIPGGTVSANSVLMTIVDPKSLSVLADLTEKQLAEVENGQLAIVNAHAEVGKPRYARVNQIDPVAASDGKIKATLELQRDVSTDQLLPGMTCDVKIRIKQASDAILIPTALVHQDEFSENSGPYVWLAGDEPQKQPVELGLERDGKREVTSGLEPGDEILKKAPGK